MCNKDCNTSTRSPKLVQCATKIFMYRKCHSLVQPLKLKNLISSISFLIFCSGTRPFQKSPNPSLIEHPCAPLWIKLGSYLEGH